MNNTTLDPIIWALLPVKRFEQAKTRLGNWLLSEYRVQPANLASSMLCDVVATLSHCQSIHCIAIVTAEPTVAQWVPSDVYIINEPDNNHSDLNQALTLGLQTLTELGAQHALILPTDTPLISFEDIDAVLFEYVKHAALNTTSIMAINSSHDLTGTNLLCISLDQPFVPMFGKNSYQAHIDQALTSHRTAIRIHNSAISLDIDTPADVQRYLSEVNASYKKVTSNTRALFTAQTDILALANTITEDVFEQTIDQLTDQAAALRDQHFGNVITYSRKVFIPLTRLCRDVCHYCTFATTPKKLDTPYLTPEQVLHIAQSGKALGCKEALFTLGEKPELRYRAANEALTAMGFNSTLEYVAHVAHLVLTQTGLLPHINAGCMSYDELIMLRPVSASMGIMLENISPRLCQKGQAHYGSPDKLPEQRLATLKNAGRAAIPMTTGILIGIGETRQERIDSLIAIRNIHRQYGHIQEVIIQNFVPKDATKMATASEPTLDDLRWTIAVARLILGPHMSLQAPPNLNTDKLHWLIGAGINDWGGVSPLTPDHVNPESPWPRLAALAQQTADTGHNLQERLTIYPNYVQQADQWLDTDVKPHLLQLADSQGLAREDDWLSGVSQQIPLPIRRQVLSKNASNISAPIQQAMDRVLNASQTIAPLHANDIATLFTARGNDFTAVCQTADQLRQHVNGNRVTYVVNRNINYTNICMYSCSFCAFSKGKKNSHASDRAYLKTPTEIASLAREAALSGATEVCLQGGIHPQFTGQTYLDICQAVHQADPHLHIHAFSPLEVWHGAKTMGMSVKSFLQRLQQLGLNTLPGTAAEILDDTVRTEICPDKLTTAQWLSVIETAHNLNLTTTATIMFGHVDNYQQWANHLLNIRTLQIRTGGFSEFVPLPFVAHEAPLYKRGLARRGPTLRESVLMHAVARLTLHNTINNIQTSWVKMGLAGAKLCLQVGANDIGGVLMNESITRAAGAVHGQQMNIKTLNKAIYDCEREPQQRNTLYQPLPSVFLTTQASTEKIPCIAANNTINVVDIL